MKLSTRSYMSSVRPADQDAFGVLSQNRSELAISSGFWAPDITPVTLTDGAVDADDGPRSFHAEYGAPRRPGIAP